MKQSSLILIFLSLFLTLSFINNAQWGNTKITLEETLVDSTAFEVDSILIVGVGDSMSQFFLENFSTSILEKLKKKNITCSYLFLGDTTEAKYKFNKLDLSNYKSVLLLVQQADGECETKTYVYKDFLPHYHFTPHEIISQIITFKQMFTTSLFKKEKSFSKIWSGTAKINTEQFKNNYKFLAKNLSQKLINCFEKYNFIEK